MTTLDVINLSPSTKEEAEVFANKLIAMVESGQENALSLSIKLNAMEKSIKKVRENIAEYALSEAEKFGSKKFETQGAEIAISELGTKYDFTVCGHPEWNECNEQVEKWTEKKKNIETMLKTFTKPVDLIIEGEPLTVQPPHKSSTTGIKMTLK